MKTSTQITVQQPAFSVMPPNAASVKSPERSASEGDQPSESIKESRISLASQGLKLVSTDLNAAAKSIRSADKRMEKVETYIDLMIERTKSIVKHFPPYLRGSVERVEMANDFNGFNKLIEQLTIPPQYEALTKRKGEIPVVHGSSEGLLPTGDHRINHDMPDIRIYSGEGGLGIPDLPTDATDEEIEAAIISLHKAKDTVGARREALVSQAEKLFSGQTEGVDLLVHQHRSYGDEMRESERDELVREKLSEEAGRDLGNTYSGSLTGGNPSIRELLV